MNQFRQTRVVILLISPALAFLVLLFIVPLVYVLVGTLTNDAGTFTLQNYTDFATDPIAQKVYWRTLRLATVVTVIAAVAGYPVAYIIARMSPARRAVMMSLIILPLMTNPVARTFSWLVILGRHGLVNNLVEWLHLSERPLHLMYTEKAIVLGLLHLFFPLMVLSLMSAMENVDYSLEHAAQSLGANRLRTFWEVVVPLSADGLIMGGTLVFTGSITAYVTPSILGGTRVLMLSTLLYQRAMVLFNWDAATVVAVVMVLTTLLVNRLLRLFRPKTL